MVDNIELRLDQITDAIKGLYAKSSTSQGEIYSVLTTLSQRYENLTNVSGEKVAATLVNEFRKSLELRYGQTNQYILNLENALKSFISSQTTQNPKLSAEISKLLNDVSNTYAKLNSQDLALQKIFSTIETIKQNDNSLEIAKLSDNFLNFSRGFENITNTLNKNFADFLSQIQQKQQGGDYGNIEAEINTISGNVNSVISAISIIDTKYKDLSGLVDVVNNKENAFQDALREVRNLTNMMNSVKETVNIINPKQDLEIFGADLKNQIENIKYEIQKIINTAGDAGVQSEVYNLTSNVNTVSNNIQTLTNSLGGTKDEVRNLTTTVQGLGSEVKSIHNLINDEILYKSHDTQNEFEKYLNSAKEDIRTLLIGLTQFKKDLNAINEGNIKVLQEPIVEAMEELKNKEIGKSIQDLSNNLRDVTFEIQSSIQNMQANLNDLNSVSSMQILTQMSEAIPLISDKLEIFRTHVVTENSTNLGEVKNTFSETIIAIKESLKNAVEKIQDDTKTINIETLDTLKLDLQRLSDHLIDSVDTIQDRVQKEFVNFKVDFQEFSIKQSDSIEKVSDKLSSLEVELENFSNDTIEKLNNTINSNSAHAQDVLNEIKSDILEGIVNIDKSNKMSLAQFENKIDKLLDNYIGDELDNIVEKKSLRETVVDIEGKIDRTNLQQIHNAKELLEEIQSTTSNLSLKISNLEENKNLTSLAGTLSKITEKLQVIEEENVELVDEFQSARENIEQRLKDNVQKISALLDKPQEDPSLAKQNSNIDNLSAKVQEYISNFEYLKGNISQEIKENLASEFAKIENSIKRIRTLDDNSNYTYTLEDVESDLAKLKLSVEKSFQNSEDFKTLFEKVIELRTVGLESVKLNRDIETELGNLSGWFRDFIEKVNYLNEKVDDIQKNSFEEIRTRLIQSEKSKNAVNEFNLKVENALRHLVKSSKEREITNNDVLKKMDLLLQAQSETFNPNQFIDIFYENASQTKMLSNRVEIIEDKINSIQNAVDKLLSYVEN